MTNLEQILCPTDLSTVSRRALEYAAGLSELFKARLHVLEVVDTSLPPTGPGVRAPYELAAPVRRALFEDLNKFVQPIRGSRSTLDVTLTEGRVTDEILRNAEALRADLIVMGTHGRGGFERFLLGSVAEHVVRKAQCPVLAVPPGERVSSGAGFRTVICAVDFAPASIRAIDYAQLLAAPGGRLILVHSVGWPFGEGTEAMPPEVQALRRSLESDAVGRLHRAATAGSRTDVFLQEAVTAGKAYAHILRCARQESADLIVMGLHSHMTNQLALLGSTTHHVLCEAPCPVLTVSDRPAVHISVTSEHPALAYSA